MNDCLKEPSSVWRLPDTITTRSRHTVTDQGGAPRPSSSLRSCSPNAVTGQTLSTRGAATDATHGRAVAHGCVHRSTSLRCLRLCRTRKSLNLAFCFDQLSSGETAACIESHRPLYRGESNPEIEPSAVSSDHPVSHPTTYYENHVCKALRKIAISRTDLRYYGWLSGFRADSPTIRCDAPIPHIAALTMLCPAYSRADQRLPWRSLNRHSPLVGCLLAGARNEKYFSCHGGGDLISALRVRGQRQ